MTFRARHTFGALRELDKRARFGSMVTATGSLTSRANVSAAPKIKGVIVLDSLKSIRARGGDAELARILSHLGSEARKVFEAPIYPWEWYSLDAFTEFLEADIRETASGVAEVLVGRAEKVIESQLRGVYRIFVKLGSPGYVVRRIASVHQTYFDDSKIIAEIEGDSATIQYIGFKARHRILEYTIIGFYRKALEISGAKKIDVRFSVPMSDDKDYSELSISWG